MNNPSRIEQTVMRRVRAVHALRPLVSLGAFSVVVALIALWGIGREVWVARVFENAPHTLFQLPQFYLAAFFHTKIVVQVLLLVAFASFITLARETARHIARLLTSVVQI